MKEYLQHTFSMDDVALVSIIDELPLWSAPFGLTLLETIELRPNINALDIGCGLGFPLIELAQRLGASSAVYGIDPWGKVLERANLKIRKLDVKNAVAVRGVAENLPFEDDVFDLIVSNNGINNVNDVRVTLSECCRVSRPGAQFTMTMNLEDTMIEFYDVFREVLNKNGLHDEVTRMKDHIYSKRRPLSETRYLLEEAGFEINGVKEDSFSFNFLDGTTMFEHYMIKYWFLGSWKSVLRADDLENIFGQVEDRLNEMAEEAGQICLTIPHVTIDCRRR